MSTLLLVLLEKTFSFNAGKLEIKLSAIKHSLLQATREIEKYYVINFLSLKSKRI
jgi:hypothetical protein